MADIGLLRRRRLAIMDAWRTVQEGWATYAQFHRPLLPAAALIALRQALRPTGSDRVAAIVQELVCSPDPRHLAELEHPQLPAPYREGYGAFKNLSQHAHATIDVPLHVARLASHVPYFDLGGLLTLPENQFQQLLASRRLSADARLGHCMRDETLVRDSLTAETFLLSLDRISGAPLGRTESQTVDYYEWEWKAIWCSPPALRHLEIGNRPERKMVDLVSLWNSFDLNVAVPALLTPDGRLTTPGPQWDRAFRARIISELFASALERV